MIRIAAQTDVKRIALRLYCDPGGLTFSLRSLRFFAPLRETLFSVVSPFSGIAGYLGREMDRIFTGSVSNWPLVAIS
jgi:hypothetical protein